MASIPKSVAETKGELVSTKSSYGGIGLGRLLGETLYVSGGNGWYYSQPCNGEEGAYEYARDGGHAYRETLRGLGLPPAYMFTL